MMNPAGVLLASAALVGTGVGGLLAQMTPRERGSLPYYRALSLLMAGGLGVALWTFLGPVGALLGVAVMAAVFIPLWANGAVFGIVLGLPMPPEKAAILGSLVFLIGLPLGSAAWLRHRWQGFLAAWGAGIVAFFLIASIGPSVKPF